MFSFSFPELGLAQPQLVSYLLLPALFFIRYKTAPTNTFKALCSLNAGKVSDVVGEAVAAVILEDALVGVDKEHKCGVKHREYEMEGEADKKKTF